MRLITTSVLMVFVILATSWIQTEPTTKKKGQSIKETLKYLNEKIDKFSRDKEDKRVLSFEKNGEVQEKYINGQTARYYLENMKSITITHFGSNAYRIRIQCKDDESSCIKHTDEKLMSRKHTDFYIQPEIEARRVYFGLKHLQTKISELEIKEPFDDMTDPPKKKRR